VEETGITLSSEGAPKGVSSGELPRGLGKNQLEPGARVHFKGPSERREKKAARGGYRGKMEENGHIRPATKGL